MSGVFGESKALSVHQVKMYECVGGRLCAEGNHIVTTVIREGWCNEWNDDVVGSIV